ncbi:MAG: porphobilinogen synthase [Candidatus Krumholzibacteriia bacterium]
MTPRDRDDNSAGEGTRKAGHRADRKSEPGHHHPHGRLHDSVEHDLEMVMDDDFDVDLEGDDDDEEIEIPGPGVIRPRRLRRSSVLRDLVAETRLHADMLCQPHFVVPGANQRQEISSMPGIGRESADRLLRTVESDLELGIRHVLLFGLPDEKTPDAHAAADPEGVVPDAVRRLKDAFGRDLVVATDICLCAYTDHGHCGVLHGDDVDNDATLPLLARMAFACAAAGAEIVAPSDMMDGRVAAIRSALDQSGLDETAIMSYAAKYASAYYGPFREAADSAPSFGDRRSYQMDPRNVREALREVMLDVDEGADIVMVKPALAYLDVIQRVRETVEVPLACYNVSGEYAMVKLAAREGLVDERLVVLENLSAMARAGADILITYHGRDALKEGWIR